MDDTVEERLAAVERALTDGDHDLSGLADAADAAKRLDDLEADVDALDDRVAELEAATQALRGYVGNVRAVNEAVEQRADLALSKAEAASEAVAGADDTGSQARPNETAHRDRPSERTAVDDGTGGRVTDAYSPRSRPTDDIADPGRSRPSADAGVPDRDEPQRDPARLADSGSTPRSDRDSQPADADGAGVLARIRALV